MTTFAHDPLAASRRDAAKRLAALVTLETGVEITTDQMLDLVLKNWDRIAAFAHQIHGTEKKPADDGWIEWKGGACPVSVGATVEIRWRQPGAHTMVDSYPHSLRWDHYDSPSDIIAYRVVKP